MITVFLLLPFFTFQRLGIEIVRISNYTMDEIEEIRSVLPITMEVGSDGMFGIDVNFHQCYVSLPSLSATEYEELAMSNTIISARVKELQELLLKLSNNLVTNCFKPLSKTLVPVFDHCQEIFLTANHTLSSLSLGLRSIRIKVEKDVENINLVLFHEETGIMTRWNQYISDDWQVYTNNILGGYTNLIFYIQRSVYTKFVVDIFLVGMFGMWVMMYISRFFPKKPTIGRILNSYAIPAFPLFIVSAVGEVVLGVCVVYDPQGIKRFFISDALLTLFFMVGFFLLFQFFVITIWTSVFFFKIVLKLLKFGQFGNGNGNENTTSGTEDEKGYIINEDRQTC